MRLVLIFTLALTIHMLQAQDKNPPKEESFIEKIRPTVSRFLGEEISEKIFGKNPIKVDAEIQMPALPKIIDDAKSTAVYNKKTDKIVLDSKVEEKFYYVFIREIYEVTRQAKPTNEEISQYLNVLSQGGTREGIYRSLVLDSVYAGMENWDKPVKSATADYAVYFYQKYLGRKVAKKNFEGMSVYTLKRLIVDRTLDLFDAFGEDRESLEKWYAILSADLAVKFPMVWQNALRKNPSQVDHKAWASKVPLQHIKSEVMIKVHTAFNSMF